MDRTINHPSTDELKRFIPLQALSGQQLTLLAGVAEIKQAVPNQILMELASNDDQTYFLLEGTLLLSSKDGHKREISADDRSAMSPIAQLRPRQYQVKCQTPVRYLMIDNAYLENLSANHPIQGGIEGYEVSGEALNETTDFEDQLSAQLLSDLEQDCLQLPSLPEVAIRIGRALEDGISDAQQIAELIQIDPVITAKLIKAANSAFYGGRNPVDTCSAAVVRLGGDVTHKLVLSYALKELFQSDSALLQSRMQQLWKHSTHVAAICYVLAKQDRRFKPEHAMLVGLLHDIGIVAILNYAKNFPDEAMQPAMIDQAITNMRAQIGSMIMNNWRFPSDFVITALEAEQWMRNKGEVPDYCDLVIIAQLHSYIGNNKGLHLPAIDEVPAHSRLELGELTPRMSLKILEQAKDQIAHAQALLNI
ncbi:HDOD domain-containing protein [Sedimenticola selenatireducens]|uniref:HDOD domain-containing protein n=1 Tax=Sedimenticola selenatireducens TaxID=191960 RepID=A0A557SHJ1_9GAMM|nr:HDOD domain-containing protein [Sedimenticola selenatireducens]TVO76861.1 HDOD domain-containing protein [Sedimenticola selenatireducens]TVT64304.1 MAG: HDOD domain-containing protein [Sedimenticola selenatireducens]